MPIKNHATIMDLLVKTMVTHPGFMESGLFRQIMKTFPEMISARYDASVVKGEGNYQDVIRAGLLSIQTQPQKILDLCTGTGVASFIATQVFPETKIVAIDQSQGMLKVAQGKAAEMGVSLIEFKLGNAAQLPEPDEAYDLIITANAPVYLSEVARVLMPGGIFMMAFFFGGPSFVKQEKNISAVLGKHGLRLLELKSVDKGVYIVCAKT